MHSVGTNIVECRPRLGALPHSMKFPGRANAHTKSCHSNRVKHRGPIEDGAWSRIKRHPDGQPAAGRAFAGAAAAGEGGAAPPAGGCGAHDSYARPTKPRTWSSGGGRLRLSRRQLGGAHFLAAAHVAGQIFCSHLPTVAAGLAGIANPLLPLLSLPFL